MSARLIKIFVFAALLVAFAPQGTGHAESLFTPAGSDLFTDFRARHIGDLVFILVNEGTNTSAESKTDGSKEIGLKGGTRVEGFLEDLLGFPNVIEPLANLDIDPSEEFKATGKTTNKGSFTTRITATIIDILPNGNFVIEGKRTITINDDEETMILMGTIRPTDISAANTIGSQYMADVQMAYTGRGQIAERQKAGIFTELFNFLF